MDNRTYLTILYDYYGDLFTEKERLYFEEYYFSNFSLSEIAENHQVSRNAIHKSIKSVQEKLENYEEKLKLYNNQQKINKLISEIKDEEIKKKLEQLN
ncbi:MAG: hypothetical protein GX641_03550 [Mollicutes bacterium]|nr:hypothetical protein [Mollicutes bacterium]